MVASCDYRKTDTTGPEDESWAATIYVEWVYGCQYRLGLEVVGHADPTLVKWSVNGVEVGSGNPFLYTFPDGEAYYSLRAKWWHEDEGWEETSAGQQIDCGGEG